MPKGGFKIHKHNQNYLIEFLADDRILVNFEVTFQQLLTIGRSINQLLLEEVNDKAAMRDVQASSTNID